MIGGPDNTSTIHRASRVSWMTSLEIMGLAFLTNFNNTKQAVYRLPSRAVSRVISGAMRCACTLQKHRRPADRSGIGLQPCLQASLDAASRLIDIHRPA
jgi:hypothetical protein